MESAAQIIENLFEKRVCACGKEFAVDASEPFAKYLKFCPDCVEAIHQKDKAEFDERNRKLHASRLISEWQELCPPLFRETDVEKLPCKESAAEALRWKFGPKGLVLHGGSGKGKSRSAWMILEREWKVGRRIKVLDSMSGLRYASKFSQSAESVEDWIESLIEVDLLFMDDIFKNKLTDSFEGVIFTLLDQRIQLHRPVILTSNDTGKTLAGRMSEDRAEPLIRRLREHSYSISFK